MENPRGQRILEGTTGPQGGKRSDAFEQLARPWCIRQESVPEHGNYDLSFTSWVQNHMLNGMRTSGLELQFSKFFHSPSLSPSMKPLIRAFVYSAVQRLKNSVVEVLCRLATACKQLC